MSRPKVGLTRTQFGSISCCTMKLAAYMELKKLKPAAMAELIGDASASGVKKWMRGERRPRPSQQQRIFEVTGGAVEPNDFILPNGVTQTEAAA